MSKAHVRKLVQMVSLKHKLKNPADEALFIKEVKVQSILIQVRARMFQLEQKSYQGISDDQIMTIRQQFAEYWESRINIQKLQWTDLLAEWAGESVQWFYANQKYQLYIDGSGDEMLKHLLSTISSEVFDVVP
jgi:hypothetical protein